jgi:hypothetical protein
MPGAQPQPGGMRMIVGHAPQPIFNGNKFIGVSPMNLALEPAQPSEPFMLSRIGARKCG